ncbi:hypothetical protein AUC43_10635 [Hymenobacter sedentarius]|uniref:Glycerophosphoryl diester phosphodiesterase membrane domain-containing protein n=1 Tax=Hymenobacter sedentarius TaxID=1411621 RepID=A0A0U3SY72_9BACT|nr:hypothetical protein [Hymenobacter sedentarius]ALW85507.1 hypothetical protein AUC43_10635 [Hymenobacter sedentarius]
MQAKLTYTREADFRRERDFGAKVGATFEFVMAQFRPLFKCLLYFVLPGALLAGIGMGLFLSNMLSMIPITGRSGHGGRISMLGNSSFLGMGMATVGFLAAFLLLSSTVYAFVRVRISTPPQEVVQPAQVWAFVWKRLGRVVAAWLVLSLLMLAGMGVLMGGLALIGPGFMFLIVFPAFWVVVCLTLYSPIIWLEDEGILASLRRSFYLIKGKWWSSLGLYMIMSFITGIVNYLFMIPFYGLMVARTMLKLPGFDSGILSVAATSIYALGWIFTAVLPLVAMLFQYFNLVERKDGIGLRQLVDSLGQTPAPHVSNSTYRPDDEGEY